MVVSMLPVRGSPHQLHTVIGSMGLAPAQFTLLAHGSQQRTPAAYAGIALAGAVSKYFNNIFTYYHWSSVLFFCETSLFSLGVAGSSFAHQSFVHLGLIGLMPGTRLIACKKYTPPQTAHQRSPAGSMKLNC